MTAGINCAQSTQPARGQAPTCCLVTRVPAFRTLVPQLAPLPSNAATQSLGLNGPGVNCSAPAQIAVVPSAYVDSAPGSSLHQLKLLQSLLVQINCMYTPNDC